MDLSKTGVVLTALTALLLSSAVCAEGFYVGGGIGYAKVEDSDSGISFDDNTMAWRVLGGYEFNQNFAIEASYSDLGEAEDRIFGSDVDVEIDAITVSAIGLLPIDDSWDLFGKLGYYDGEADATVSGFGSASDDDSGVTVGAGVRYNFSDELALRGEFDWYDTDLDTLWVVGLTLQYTFPQ